MGRAAAADPAGTAQTAGQSTVPAATPGKPPAPEEVVVTGRAHPEALQNAPVAVTVFNSKAIADARLHDVSDFISLTPNVSVTEAQNSGSAFVTVRGLSQVRNGQSPVAIVVDGVQQMNPRQFSQDLFDTSQIEVLRGPQGALYGRNAIGGAIVITTEQPTNTFHTSESVSFGNGDDYRARASVSGPIVKDKLLFKLSGLYHYFGGLLDNVNLDQPVDESREYALRGQLKALPTDNLTINLTAGVDETKGGALNYQYQPVKFDPNHPCFTDPNDPYGGPPVDADRVVRSFCATNPGHDHRDIQDVSLRASYTLPFATVTNTLAAVRVTEYYDGDAVPYTATVDGTQAQWSRQSSWSDDLRIVSPNTGRLRWMAGGYFLSEHDFLSSTTSTDTGSGIYRVSTSPLYNLAANPTQTFYGNSDNNQEYSLFANVSYRIVKGLTIEGGYRYDWNVLNQYAEPYSTGTLPTGCTLTSRAACNRSQTFSRAQPKVTLDYVLNAHVNLFTDYGVGFRSGIFNQAGTAAAAGLVGVSDLVRPEIAKTFEAGIKTRWLNGRLRFSATFFDTDDEDSSYFVFVPAAGSQILVNIDDTRLYGGELEASYTVLRGLDVFATYGITQSTIRSYAFNPNDVGHRAPYIPMNSATVGAQYHFPIMPKLGGFARADVEVHGRQYWDPENSTARSTFAIGNLQFGVEDPKGRWSAIAFVKNVADTRYNAEYVTGGFVQPAEPRMVGGELRFNY